MEIKATPIQGLFELIPQIWQDNRGWFTEMYKHSTFKDAGLEFEFTQDNLSFSKKGVVRGLHLQLGNYTQTKLVRVMSGRVLDVVVDLRKESETFGKVFSCELDALKQNMLLIPGHFAHGFAALEDSLFYYKCSNVYSKAHEAGIIWNDPDLNIDWKIQDPVISDKDKLLPTFSELARKL
jgi:dTDP-4-dehydrorhamnose 3,5-epimerase